MLVCDQVEFELRANKKTGLLEAAELRLLPPPESAARRPSQVFRHPVSLVNSNLFFSLVQRAASNSRSRPAERMDHSRERASHASIDRRVTPPVQPVASSVLLFV